MGFRYPKRKRRDYKGMTVTVLFVDIVGFAKRDTNIQMRGAVEHLENSINDVFDELEWDLDKKQSDLILIPTGDGYAIGFHPEITDYRVTEYVKKLYVKLRDKLDIRMGIHKGPNLIYVDLNDNLNMMGFGITLAQRVMSVAEPNQILCGRDFAEPLKRDRGAPELIGPREAEIKHGDKIVVYDYCIS